MVAVIKNLGPPLKDTSDLQVAIALSSSVINYLRWNDGNRKARADRPLLDLQKLTQEAKIEEMCPVIVSTFSFWHFSASSK